MVRYVIKGVQAGEFSVKDLQAMTDFFQRLALSAATTDELLSDAFVPLLGEKSDAVRAALRLAAWCRSSSGGDWSQFSARLARDGLTLEQALKCFATVRRNPTSPQPLWLSDAIWVSHSLGRVPAETSIRGIAAGGEEQPFEHLLFTAVEAADQILRSQLDSNAFSLMSEGAHSMLRHALLSQLAELCAPAFYEAFSGGSQRNQVAKEHGATAVGYASFINRMREGGFVQLFEARPVLLRLMASMARQWIEANSEFILRLSSDLSEIRFQLCNADYSSLVTSVRSQISDHHNFGRSVLLVGFADGHRVVYKPKDLRIDSAWLDIVSWLNIDGAPLDLQTARVVVRDGYGWAEHIDHVECTNTAEFEKFFQRAGCWLALFHVFAGTDIHKENVVARGAHPVPIDLEMLLQAEEPEKETQNPNLAALKLAARQISNSVVLTGLLPSYSRNLKNRLVDIGGMSQPAAESMELYWENINQDGMRLAKRPKKVSIPLNVPSIGGAPAQLADFVRDFVSGFNVYAKFLSDNKERILSQSFWQPLHGLPVRKVVRPTKFYYLLLSRLRNPNNMGDGAEWSAHLDFCSRLTGWDGEDAPFWPLLRSERNALANLNIPHFVMQSDGTTVMDRDGITASTRTESGLDRARARLQRLDAREVSWQSEMIRIATAPVSSTGHGDVAPLCEPPHSESGSFEPMESQLLRNAAGIISHISKSAIRSGVSAAWIGLDWHGDSEASRLVHLGHDLYSGATGVSLVLAAHARVTCDQESAKLALAGLAALRFHVRSASAARFARQMGLGGALGMGSIVYALTVIGDILGKGELIDDAIAAATLFTDEFIASDRAFDAIGGSAGVILCLLKLYRETGDKTVLARAVKCGKHLLRNRPRETTRELIWYGVGISARPLAGMSHGAAGFAYAFGSLHEASGEDGFLRIAHECLQFENGLFDQTNGNWPDLRQHPVGFEKPWPCQWCHGAGGIGLARIGMLRSKAVDTTVLINDIIAAVKCVEMRWPDPLDTLCCGSLGNIELLIEAGVVLKRSDLQAEAVRRLKSIMVGTSGAGGFRLGLGGRRFNLGLYRGIAGVGYTLLRQLSPKLPNVLLWE